MLKQIESELNRVNQPLQVREQQVVESVEEVKASQHEHLGQEVTKKIKDKRNGGIVAEVSPLPKLSNGQVK